MYQTFFMDLSTLIHGGFIEVKTRVRAFRGIVVYSYSRTVEKLNYANIYVYVQKTHEL